MPVCTHHCHIPSAGRGFWAGSWVPPPESGVCKQSMSSQRPATSLTSNDPPPTLWSKPYVNPAPHSRAPDNSATSRKAEAGVAGAKFCKKNTAQARGEVVHTGTHPLDPSFLALKTPASALNSRLGQSLQGSCKCAHIIATAQLPGRGFGLRLGEIWAVQRTHALTAEMGGSNLRSAFCFTAGG